MRPTTPRTPPTATHLDKERLWAVARAPSLGLVTNKERAVRSREDFRQLPPRITPEQMIPLQAVPHLVQDPREGVDTDEWHVRMGWAG